MSMLMLICVLRIHIGHTICAEGDKNLLDQNVAECVKASSDPIGTCNMMVTSDKKRWFFVYGGL
jgi:hypothetical protein